MVGMKLPVRERRRMILDAAARIALSEGLENVTVRKVAASAGVSPGLAFHHYGSKDGLLLGLLNDLLERTLDAGEGSLVPGVSGQERLFTLVAEEVAGLETQTANVELLFAYFFARRDDLFRAPIRAALRRYGDAFAAAAAAVAPADVDSEELVHLVISLIEGAAVTAIVAPEQFRPDRLTQTLAAVLGTSQLRAGD